jgi:hypothetical protein
MRCVAVGSIFFFFLQERSQHPRLLCELIPFRSEERHSDVIVERLALPRVKAQIVGW